MKIVELLKMRKKEENESKSKNKKKDEIKLLNEEENMENLKNKTISSYGYKPKMKILEKLKRDRNLENSLPKKSFRDEEDDGNNTYDFNNRTQNQFRNYKTINNNNIPNNNDLNKKVNSYFNLKENNNNNISQNIIYNKNKVNSNINNYQNYNINKINYKNSFNLKNKFYEKLRNYYTVKNENNNNVNYNNNLEINKKINKNFNTLDNSFDKNKKRKNIIPKRTINKSTLNDKIYKPKKISNNNSPNRQDLNQYERNTINYNNTINDIGSNYYHNFINYSKDKKSNKAYIKKSPKKYEVIKNSLNYRTVDNDRNINNARTNKLINGSNNANIYKGYNRLDASPEIPMQSKILNSINLYNNTYRGKDEYFLPDKVNYNNFNKNVKRNISQKNKNRSSNSIMFNIEDLIILEDRLNDVILALETNDNLENKCLYFWNYYFNCSLYNLLEKIFKNKGDSNIIRLSINYKLISIMVCYEYSFEIDPTEEELYLLLLELMDLNHNNLIIICEYILTKIIPENKQNIWVLKLQQIIKKAQKSGNKYLKNNISQTSIEQINFNNNLIIKSLKNILLNFPTEYSDIIISLLKKIDIKTYEEINDFFKQYILHVENFEGSIMASSYFKKNKYFRPLPAPYLVSQPTKPYTLILDLDETLVHFKIKTSKGGTLRARPYLFGFLEEMGHYYELVVWTSATEGYANSLIDAIEYEKKYFDYILFREHAIIMGDDFVKDLTRVGRGLDKIIIIDDMPQNFRLQKENGITIKPFFGDDLDDSALYELVPILKHIAEDEYDVRIGLNKYREEIVKRVTSNISKQNIY